MNGLMPLRAARYCSRFPGAFVRNGVGTRAILPLSSNHTPEPSKINAWKSPGAAAFDFRSDVTTKPTSSMLEAITNASLLDDDFREDPQTNSLQEFIARLTGQEDALLVVSGTMGNQVAIRSHLTQPPYAVLCDERAHIINYEGGGASTWTGAYIRGIEPRNGRYLVLEDIQKYATIDPDGEDIHGCPTRLISLENTLDGSITPLNEARRICEWAHENRVKVHLDGARLWEAAVSGAGSVTEYARLFDSVSVCFSKGLGAPIGSMVAGSNSFIKKARWCRKAMGGGTRQSGVISSAARVAVEETFGHGPNGEGGKLRETHKRAKQVSDMWTSRGGELLTPTETNMVWPDLDAAAIHAADWDALGEKYGLKLMGNRLVIHYQISDEAVQRLEKVMDAALSRTYESSTKSTTKRYYGQK